MYRRLVGPLDGAIAVTVGTARYVKTSLAVVVEVPPGVATVTSTGPAVPAGAVAVIEVAESAVTVPGFAPKSTAVAEPRLVPVTTTDVPPAVGPLDGAMLATVGTAVATVRVKVCVGRGFDPVGGRERDRECPRVPSAYRTARHR